MDKMQIRDQLLQKQKPSFANKLGKVRKVFHLNSSETIYFPFQLLKGCYRYTYGLIFLNNKFKCFFFHPIIVSTGRIVTLKTVWSQSDRDSVWEKAPVI